MTRKKTLQDYSIDEMQFELDARWADEHYQAGMTMSQMEVLIWEHRGMDNPAAARVMAALLRLLKPEKPTGKPCPKCGKRTPVKARDRERTLRTMAGPVTLKRNYHYCEKCLYGFYPLDRQLDLPEEGELTAEMEKRVLDFGVTDVYGDAATRWSVHYREPISDNLLRRVVSRVGAQCEQADPYRLQEQLKPKEREPADVLVVEYDGSQLPIRGPEPWKEAKVGLTYRYDTVSRMPLIDSARYTALVGCLDEFAPLLQDMLEIEGIEDARTVIWLGDGLPSNWTLADQLAPDAVQILDWYHAVENAMVCAKAVLGDESPFLPVWQRSIETLLARGEPQPLLDELMNCIPLVPKGRRGSREALEALDSLVRYYRTNAHRMRYRLFREYGYPIGSGAVESAHKHVLQVRMKRAGQRWAIRNARRMSQLRAAYRTGGPLNFHSAIRRAHRDTLSRRFSRPPRRHSFRWARYGDRDLRRSQDLRSN